MSKRILSLVLALVMVLGTFGTVFAAETGNEKIDWLVEQGIVKGDASGDLMLDKNIDRASVAKMVVEALGQQAAAAGMQGVKSIFPDVPAGHWSNGNINIVNGLGLMKGNAKGQFMPSATISYAEVVTILVRMMNGFTAEEEKTAVWPASYIAKANELGILNDITVANFSAAAVRKDILEMFYNAMVNLEVGKYSIVKGIVLENYRVEKLDKDEIVIEIIQEVQRAEYVKESRDKKGEQISLKVPAKVGDVEALLGRVADFTVDENNNVIKVKYDESYKVVTGSLKATKNKMGSYTVEVDERYKEKDDRIFRTYLNNKGYAYGDFYENPLRDKGAKAQEDYTVDYARITVKNGKVLFIDAFDFDDIAPVKEVKKDGAEVNVYNDARDGGTKKYELKDSTKVVTVKDGVFGIGSKADIEANDVIHEFGGNFIVRKDAKVDGTYKKVSVNRDKETYVHVDDTEYYVPEDTSKKPVYAYDSKEFATLEADVADRVLREFKDEKVTVLLDISDNLQYIGSEIELGEFVALLNNVLSKDIKVVRKDNTKSEYVVTFDSTLKVDGSTKYQNLDKFNKGDLVYLSVDGTDVDTMIRLVSADEKGTLVQKDSKDKYMLSTNSITLETNNEYKVLDRTNVFIRSGNTLKGTTIEDVKKAQDNDKNLRAYVLSDYAYGDLVREARRDVSERKDIAHTIIFTEVTDTVSYDKEVVEIVKTYTTGRDVEIDVKFASDKDSVTRKVDRDSKAYDAIKAKDVKIGDIVELSITKDDDKLVKDVKLLIAEDADVYEVYSISSRTGYRTIVLEGIGGKTDRKEFWLDRDADVFGNLEEGAKVSYYSGNQKTVAADKNPDIEAIYVEKRTAKVTGTFTNETPATGEYKLEYTSGDYVNVTLKSTDVESDFRVIVNNNAVAVVGGKALLKTGVLTNELYKVALVKADAPDKVLVEKSFFGLAQADIDAKEDVKADKAALTIAGDLNNVTADLALITTGTEKGSTITWVSSDKNIVKDSTGGTLGAVTRPSYTDGDKTVTLTATITKGVASDTKVFTVVVKKDAQTDAEKAKEIANGLELTFKAGDSAANVTDDITLPTNAEATSITWTSNDTDFVAIDGKVVRPSGTDVTVKLTATVTVGTDTATKIFTVVVKAQ